MILALGKLKKVDRHVFKTSLDHRVVSSLTWPLEWPDLKEEAPISERRDNECLVSVALSLPFPVSDSHRNDLTVRQLTGSSSECLLLFPRGRGLGWLQGSPTWEAVSALMPEFLSSELEAPRHLWGTHSADSKRLQYKKKTCFLLGEPKWTAEIWGTQTSLPWIAEAARKLSCSS